MVSKADVAVVNIIKIIIIAEGAAEKILLIAVVVTKLEVIAIKVIKQ